MATKRARSHAYHIPSYPKSVTQCCFAGACFRNHHDHQACPWNPKSVYSRFSGRLLHFPGGIPTRLRRPTALPYWYTLSTPHSLCPTRDSNTTWKHSAGRDSVYRSGVAFNVPNRYPCSLTHSMWGLRKETFKKDASLSILSIHAQILFLPSFISSLCPSLACMPPGAYAPDACGANRDCELACFRKRLRWWVLPLF